LAGFILINSAAYTPHDIFKTLFKGGVSSSHHPSSLSSLLLYLVELPSVVSLPVLILAAGGSYSLIKQFSKSHLHPRLFSPLTIICLSLSFNVLLTLFRLDHFPRHLLPFIPWISIFAAWGLHKVSDKLAEKKLSPYLAILPIFVYLALFVYDGERVFIEEPRNEAARWILKNVAQGTPIYWRTPDHLNGYPYVHFPTQGRPPVLVIQMDRANHYLSGMGLRNSYPRDYRSIFNAESQVRIEGLQAVFKGTSEYREVARFKEGYFMPEYVLVDKLIGNRSRNYVAEIVIFLKRNEPVSG
jgi:hypothetical protein